MKILHVITSLRTGGAEKLMVDLLPRMKMEANDVDLCVFDGERTPFYDEIEERGIKVIPLGLSVYSLTYVPKLIRLIKHYDIVHAHNTACQYFVAIASLLSSCSIYTTEHNTTNRRRNVWWKMLDQCMYGRYKKIVCISELTKSNLIKHIGDKFERQCTIIYNGIDLDKFTSLDQQVFGNSNIKIIIMVSAFRKQKDQKTLIKAMKKLPSNYKLELVGGGDESLINECKELAQSLGVDDRILFLGVRSDIPMLLCKSDVVVLSSHYEGLSLSSIEGMASGKPFIASDVDGLHDIVEGYGVLVPHEDESSLAVEIQHLCKDREYARVISKKCKERAEMFDIKLMTERYVKLYQEYCNR